MRIRAFTAGGAYAEFAEHKKGMLREGMLADVLVLDGDIEAVADREITSLKPAVTICDGRVTYEA